MPVLRMPTDNTLGDTLGNLGARLTEAFNPLNQIRAQDLLAQMRQRQWEIQHQQQLDAANANAAEVYRRANPHNLSAADLEVAVAQIRNGQYNASQTIEALKAAGGYQAAQAAAGLVDAQHPEWSPAQRLSAKQQILQGKSLSEVEQSYATAANETNKATATIGGTNAAVTPAAKEAAAIGQPETATKLDTQERLRTAPPITGPLNDPKTQQAIDTRTIERSVAGAPVTADAPVSIGEAGPIATQRAEATATGDQQAITSLAGLYKDDPSQDAWNRMIYSAINKGAQFEPGMPVPIGPNTNAAYQKALGNRQETQAEAEARGKVLGGGIDPSKPLVIPQLAPSANPTLQTPPPQTPAPTPANPNPLPPAPAPTPTAPVQAPLPKGATPDPTHPGWYWQGGQLKPATTTGGPAGTILGTQPGDIETANTTTAGAGKTLNDAYAAGEAATKLQTITQQLRGLEIIAHTTGFWGQTGAAINDFASQYHLGGITNQQMAQQLMKQLVTTELPGMLKQYDIVRFAKPEIDLMNRVMGDPTADPRVINGILANLDTAAQYTVQRKNLASRALGFGSTDPSQPDTGPINYPEFQQGDAALLNDYNTKAQANRDAAGAIGANQPSAAPVVTTQGGANPTPDFWGTVGNFLSNLGRPPTPAPESPTPQPNAPPSHELQYNPATNSWQ